MLPLVVSSCIARSRCFLLKPQTSSSGDLTSCTYKLGWSFQPQANHMDAYTSWQRQPRFLPRDISLDEADHQLSSALQHLQRQRQQQYLQGDVSYNLFVVACNVAGLQTQTPVVLSTVPQLSSAHWEQLLKANLGRIRDAQQPAALQHAVDARQRALDAQTQTL